MKTFYFNHRTGEFVEGSAEMSDNYVNVRSYDDPEGPSYQFEVHIDDFGCVIAALNRLVRRFIPTFEAF